VLFSRLGMSTVDPVSRKDALCLLKNGLDLALQQAAAKHAMPICWVAAERDLMTYRKRKVTEEPL
jgi:hypothetical protein